MKNTKLLATLLNTTLVLSTVVVPISSVYATNGLDLTTEQTNLLAHDQLHDLDLNSLCDQAVEKYYHKDFPSYEEIEVLYRGSRVKFIDLTDEQKFELFATGATNQTDRTTVEQERIKYEAIRDQLPYQIQGGRQGEQSGEPATWTDQERARQQFGCFKYLLGIRSSYDDAEVKYHDDKGHDDIIKLITLTDQEKLDFFASCAITPKDRYILAEEQKKFEAIDQEQAVVIYDDNDPEKLAEFKNDDDLQPQNCDFSQMPEQDLRRYKREVFEHLFQKLTGTKDKVARYSAFHGPRHALRAFCLAQAVFKLYKECYQEFDHASNDDLKLAALAAVFHDSGRQGEYIDIFDDLSAQNCYDELVAHGVPASLAQKAKNAIEHKDVKKDQDPANFNDPIRIALHEADCLEYKRLNWVEFKKEALNCYQLTPKSGLNPQEISKRIDDLIAKETNFVARVSQSDMQHHEANSNLPYKCPKIADVWKIAEKLDLFKWDTNFSYRNELHQPDPSLNPDNPRLAEPMPEDLVGFNPDLATDDPNQIDRYYEEKFKRASNQPYELFAEGEPIQNLYDSVTRILINGAEGLQEDQKLMNRDPELFAKLMRVKKLLGDFFNVARKDLNEDFLQKVIYHRLKMANFVVRKDENGRPVRMFDQLNKRLDFRFHQANLRQKKGPKSGDQFNNADMVGSSVVDDQGKPFGNIRSNDGLSGTFGRYLMENNGDVALYEMIGSSQSASSDSPLSTAVKVFFEKQFKGNPGFFWKDDPVDPNSITKQTKVPTRDDTAISVGGNFRYSRNFGGRDGREQLYQNLSTKSSDFWRDCLSRFAVINGVNEWYGDSRDKVCDTVHQVSDSTPRTDGEPFVNTVIALYAFNQEILDRLDFSSKDRQNNLWLSRKLDLPTFLKQTGLISDPPEDIQKIADDQERKKRILEWTDAEIDRIFHTKVVDDAGSVDQLMSMDQVPNIPAEEKTRIKKELDTFLAYESRSCRNQWVYLEFLKERFKDYLVKEAFTAQKLPNGQVVASLKLESTSVYDSTGMFDSTDSWYINQRTEDPANTNHELKYIFPTCTIKVKVPLYRIFYTYLPSHLFSAPEYVSMIDNETGCREAVACLKGCQFEYQGMIEHPTLIDKIYNLERNHFAGMAIPGQDGKKLEIPEDQRNRYSNKRNGFGYGSDGFVPYGDTFGFGSRSPITFSASLPNTPVNPPVNPSSGLPIMNLTDNTTQTDPTVNPTNQIPTPTINPTTNSIDSTPTVNPAVSPTSNLTKTTEGNNPSGSNPISSTSSGSIPNSANVAGGGDNNSEPKNRRMLPDTSTGQSDLPSTGEDQGKLATIVGLLLVFATSSLAMTKRLKRKKYVAKHAIKK